jgi:GT2 family glycosyltransferase
VREPAIAVAIASLGRPLRLRWLLNALGEQTLERAKWEVVVATQPGDAEAEALLDRHPLAADDTLRHTMVRDRTTTAARRNSAWRLTAAPLVAFTEDDCIPPPDWLERALSAARRHPGAIVQGACIPDPDAWPVTATAPHPRTRHVLMPPTPWAEACNIVYPRAVLEAIDGFLDDVVVAEDCELALRAQQAGFPRVGAPELLIYAAAHDRTIADRARDAWTQRDLPRLLRIHPQLRRQLPSRIFWKRSHLWLMVAAAGLALGRHRPALAVLALPWARIAWEESGVKRGPVARIAALPGRWIAESVEVAFLAWGSRKHRVLFL